MSFNKTRKKERINSVLIVLLLPALSFAIISKYQGKFHAVSFSISGGEKMKTDAKDDGITNGNITIGEKDKTVLQNLQGKTNKKFKAQITQTDGSTLSINGSLPDEKERDSISSIQKKIVKGNGSKNVSESGPSGFIKRITGEDAPEIEPAIKIEYAGKTHLLFWKFKPAFFKRMVSGYNHFCHNKLRNQNIQNDYINIRKWRFNKSFQICADLPT